LSLQKHYEPKYISGDTNQPIAFLRTIAI